MTLKQTIGSLARTTGQLPLIVDVVHHPAVRNRIEGWPGMRIIYTRGGLLRHPFDLQHQTDTSGAVASEELPPSRFVDKHTAIYAGSQPSLIRTALTALPALEDFHFVDLGCGKGRPLLVASEFPFRSITGLEFSPPLAEIARANIEIVRKEYPPRPPMRVEIGDAGDYQFPSGNFVVFLYHPFGQEIMRRVVTAIESALILEDREIYVVYYNPVWGTCFDFTPHLRRYFAARLPYAREERGYGANAEEVVVIWQSGRSKSYPGAEARIKIAIPHVRAELE